MELEVHTKVTVPVKSREDAHAIKLLNLKSSAHQLCTQVGRHAHEPPYGRPLDRPPLYSLV